MIPLMQIDLSPEYAAALVAGSVVLALGVIALLTWSVRSLVSFTKVMRSLNESLADSYKEREILRKANEEQAILIDKLEADARRMRDQLNALQFDKGALADALEDLRKEMAASAETHAGVVEALTAQIGQLKQAVADEQVARQKVERDLTQKIEALTKQNAALTAENVTLRQDLAETKAALTETDNERNVLQAEVAALRAEVAAIRSRTEPAPEDSKQTVEQEQEQN